MPARHQDIVQILSEAAEVVQVHYFRVGKFAGGAFAVKDSPPPIAFAANPASLLRLDHVRQVQFPTPRRRGRATGARLGRRPTPPRPRLGEQHRAVARWSSSSRTWCRRQAVRTSMLEWCDRGNRRVKRRIQRLCHGIRSRTHPSGSYTELMRSQLATALFHTTLSDLDESDGRALSPRCSSGSTRACQLQTNAQTNFGASFH